MQLKKSALFCAAAFAAMAAGSAHAALSGAHKTMVDNANTNGRVLFISGASAVQKGFGTIAASMLNSPVRFTDISTKSTKDYEAYAGTLKAAAGTWAAGSNVIIIYRVEGGSVYGVDSVARADVIKSLNVTSDACGISGQDGTSVPYTCTNDTRTPDAGVSDVAPKYFKYPYNTEGETAAAQLSATELARFTGAGKIAPLYGLAFGIAATNALGDVNLSRAKIAAIFGGNVTNWSDVDETGAESGPIVVCRRVPGSGTQAVFNMWAGNFPCGTFNVPADRSKSGSIWNSATKTYTIPAALNQLVVVENSTSSDVRTCLDKAQVGGTYTTKDRSGNTVNVNFQGSGGHKAVGTLSLDSLSSAKSPGNWQFRSLDGAGKYYWNSTSGAVSTTGTGKFPTKETYENGDWDLQGWVTLNIPARTAGNAKRALLDQFVAKAQDPAVLQGITDLKNVAMAIPGGDYEGDQVLTAEYVNGDQCAPFVRSYPKLPL
ncbi:substrate-binding domain-containing protein [Ferribacterium limneticum]|uniref:substrate-binding domain-containing protein n=1 Tax=Ferribacterium limneticum TaxID=76259 RepID=UPI001CFA48DB|nr:substrate-binding domain-containing protein [Ferribacterium limneticum]UCV30007.1 substrate-binding domain-containing protein [Ferribacterium limneticum]UCV33926.1 substrate-binding domain-containing protein [Ferribacterium limneticum]